MALKQKNTAGGGSASNAQPALRGNSYLEKSGFHRYFGILRAAGFDRETATVVASIKLATLKGAVTANEVAEALRKNPRWWEPAAAIAPSLLTALTNPDVARIGQSGKPSMLVRAALLLGSEAKKENAEKTAQAPKSTELTLDRAKFYLKWLSGVKKGMSRGRVNEETVAKALSGIKDFGYDNNKAKKAAGEIVFAFGASIGELARARVARLDILAKMAILLRDDISNTELAVDAISALGPEFRLMLAEFDKERFTAAVRKQDAEAKMAQIILSFNRLSESAPREYKSYTMAFSEEGAEQFAKLYLIHSGNPKSEFNQLCSALPYLHLEPILRKTGPSPSRGLIGGDAKYTYNGRKYRLHHAGANHTNIRAKYIIDENNKIVITGFYIAHPN